MQLKYLLLSSLLAIANAQKKNDVISRCREVGFHKFAEALEDNPAFVASINARSDTTVWAVPDEVIEQQFGNNTKLHKRQSTTALAGQAVHKPPGPAARKRASGTNAETLYQYLEDPAFVNLGCQWGGATTAQLNGPFVFDKGVIIGVVGFFTLPTLWSQTIQNDGRADQFYAAVVHAKLESFFDNTPACTVFAPIDTKKYHGHKLDPKKYIICNFLGHSPQLLPGTTYYSVDGTPIKITWGSDGIKRVNGIEFVQTDLITKNGVLHLIKKPFKW
ncbi:hypothetical protein BDD12DRAFT_872484 [Trichophaea hybrida]|nr:hypothetical protein BDD12DRAFT_872484 [Trichophaea hybrida]